MSMPEPHRHGEATGRKAGVVIASTRAAAGIYEDLTGPVIIDWLTEHGFETYPAMVVPDGEAVGAALRALLTQAPAVIITSGGTGLSPTDATPEQTLPLLDREIPGIMEGIRGAGTAKTPHGDAQPGPRRRRRPDLHRQSPRIPEGRDGRPQRAGPDPRTPLRPAGRQPWPLNS